MKLELKSKTLIGCLVLVSVAVIVIGYMLYKKPNEIVSKRILN
jgi:hypothetical protein